MQIVFTTDLAEDEDGFFEKYTATVTMKDVVSASIVLSATSDEVDYAEFQANIYRDLLESITDANGDSLEIIEECPEEDFDAFFESCLPIGEQGILFGFQIDDEDDTN